MNLADFDVNLIEKAFLHVVADKLGMTVDVDIFPGAIPPGIDGAAVWITGEQIDNNPHRPSFYIEFMIKDVDRRHVMDKVFALAKQFPAGNLSAAVDGETIRFVSVLKNNLEIEAVTDRGQLKYLASLEMTVVI